MFGARQGDTWIQFRSRTVRGRSTLRLCALVLVAGILSLGWSLAGLGEERVFASHVRSTAEPSEEPASHPLRRPAEPGLEAPGPRESLPPQPMHADQGPQAEVSSPAEPEPPQQLFVSGRLLLPNGDPAVGVPVEFSSPRLPRRVSLVDAEGSFFFQLGLGDPDPEAALHAALLPHLEIRKHLSRWREPDYFVGDLTLAGSAPLTGQVVFLDPPQPDDWSMVIDGQLFPVDSEGRFTCEDAPAGPLEISPWHKILGQLQPHSILVEAGRAQHVEILVDAPDPRRCIAVASLLEETIELRPAPKMEPYVAFDGTITFYDLAPGRYEVLVRSATTSDPWVSPPVQPGTRVQAPSMRLLHQGYFGD